MKCKPRILFVINSLAGGGAERILLSLLVLSQGKLADFDYSLALLDDEARDYTSPDWLTVHQLDARFSMARSVVQLRALAKREKPDLILSFLTRANVASVAVARMLGLSCIISERVGTSSHLSGGLGAKLARLMVRVAYPRADRVIAVSAGIGDDLTANFGVDAARVRVIANPVDAEAIRAAAAGPVEVDLPAGPFIVAVSRLTRTKNPVMIVDALARSGLDLPLVLLGKGPEEGAIRARADALGLSDRVIMPGFVANPHAVMQRATLYVSASNAEGFPNGLLEAMALGLPVVATNCMFGPSEVLAESPRDALSDIVYAPHGVVVPTDDPAALGEAMAVVLEPDRRTHYAHAAARRVGAYGPELARDAYWQAIAEVLAEHGGQ